jgi:lactate dehydrogenase-like 2-hydroxyacid dehydrogenase
MVNPMSRRISRRVLEAAEQVKLVQSIVVGYDNIDVEAATELGIPVANNPGWNSTSVAEHTLMLILMTLKQTLYAIRKTDEGKGWRMPDDFRDLYPKIGELKGRTLGLIGLGSIGKEVAKRAGAFGAKIVYYKRSRLTSGEEEGLGVEYRSFEGLLAESDIVSLHVPLTDETRGMIWVDEIALMKNGAIIINTARGGILDEQAAAVAIKTGKLSGAGMDDLGHRIVDGVIFGDSPLIECDNVVTTPHLAGTSWEALTQSTVQWVANVAKVLSGETPLYLLNDVWPSEK